MKLYYASISDVGNVRVHNEDFLYTGKISDGEYLFIVADGMGGHNAGEVASYKAVSAFVTAVKKGLGDETNQVMAAMKQTLLDVNRLIYRAGKQSETHKGMGTTVSAMYIKDNRGYVVHVGDSRIYRYSQESLEQLTDDHSLVGRLLKEGYISEGEALNHPKRNVLYQSIGLKQKIDVQSVGPFPVREGDKFMLCSDGLINEVHDIQLEDFMRMKSPSKIARGLVDLAKSGTAADNITVIMVSTLPGEPGETEPENTFLEPLPGPPRPERKDTGRRSKIGIYILLVILLFLLAAIIYLAYKQVEKSDNDLLPEIKTLESRKNLTRRYNNFIK